MTILWSYAVVGSDSCLRGRELESQFQTLDGHFLINLL